MLQLLTRMLQELAQTCETYRMQLPFWSIGSFILSFSTRQIHTIQVQVLLGICMLLCLRLLSSRPLYCSLIQSGWLSFGSPHLSPSTPKPAIIPIAAHRLGSIRRGWLGRYCRDPGLEGRYAGFLCKLHLLHHLLLCRLWLGCFG